MPYQKLKIHNDSTQPLRLVIEPWGEERQIEPDREVDVVFRSELSGEIEASYGRGKVRLFGWEGCTYFVLENNLWDGPTILQLIKHRSSSEAPDDASRILSEIQQIDEVEYVQVQMDNAPYWDAVGRETAIAIAERVQGDLTEAGAEEIGKLVAADIRSSRGVFDESGTEQQLREDSRH